MLSAAKHLEANGERPFAALRVTRQGKGDRRGSGREAFATLRVTREPCHVERSEASRGPSRETLRCAQGDKNGLCHATACTLCSSAEPLSPSGSLDRWLRLMSIGADNDFS